MLPENSNNNKRNKNVILKKRIPRKPVDGDNVFFITRKSNFKVQLDNCIDLLGKGEKEIILHGLGAAIQRTCNLAVQTQLAFPGTHDTEVNTDTIDITDDLIAKDFDAEHTQNHRYQSAIHIRIFRKALVGANNA